MTLAGGLHTAGVSEGSGCQPAHCSCSPQGRAEDKHSQSSPESATGRGSMWGTVQYVQHSLAMVVVFKNFSVFVSSVLDFLAKFWGFFSSPISGNHLED